MPSNAAAAELLRRIADLLDLRGEAFKPEAYRRAARSVEALPEPLAQYASRGQLRQIPGIGEAIADKLSEFLRDGRLAYLEKLELEIPPGVVELMRRPGIGPKTARRLWTEFQIDGPAALGAAIDAGRLAGTKGFGERKIAQFREAAAGGAPTGRIPIERALPVARRLIAELQPALRSDERAEIAGSLRRARETIGDVDLLVGSERSGEIFDRVGASAEVASVVLRGDTKMTVLLTSGVQVDVRVVAPESYGSALQYFTGSKEHNVRLRSLARDLGLKINEYGVYRDDTAIAGRTEFDVYDAVGLSWIPPEMREDRGEIDRAATDSLPAVVEEKGIRGELHWHLPANASPDDVDRTLAEARRRRYDYVGVVVRGFDGDGEARPIRPETLERLRERTSRRRPGEAGILWAEEGTGTERGPPAAEIHYRLIRADLRRLPPAGAPPPGAWGLVHLGAAPATGEGLGRWRAWLTWGASVGLSAEIGPGSDRLDSEGGREYLALGGSLLVATGIDRPEGDPTAAIALGFARRAWATPAVVRNTARPEDLGGAPPQDATMRSKARRARSATDGSTSMR